MLENGDESRQSTARCVGTLLAYQNLDFNEPNLYKAMPNVETLKYIGKARKF
jgi:hypothetical protein